MKDYRLPMEWMMADESHGGSRSVAGVDLAVDLQISNILDYGKFPSVGPIRT